VGLLALLFRRADASSPGLRTALSFLVLFLLVWAGGAWVARFDLFRAALYWLPFAFIGLMVTLALAVLAPPRRPFRTPPRIEGTELAGQKNKAFTGFLWVFIFALALLVALAYIA
jgi:hypothetical protein